MDEPTIPIHCSLGLTLGDDNDMLGKSMTNIVKSLAAGHYMHMQISFIFYALFIKRLLQQVLPVQLGIGL